MLNLGTVVCEKEISDEEKQRIIDSIISKSGVPYKIFLENAKHTQSDSFWAAQIKRLKITGFRPNTDKAKSLVIRSVLKKVEKGDSFYSDVLASWYQNSVVRHINTQHPNLDKILLEKELPAKSEQTTDNIFVEINKWIDVYEVRRSELLLFYEACWFERSNNIEEIVNQRFLDLDIVKGLIHNSEEKTSNAINRLESKLDDQKERLEKYTLRKDSFNENFSKFRSEMLAEISSTKIELNNYFASQIEAIERKLDSDFLVKAAKLVDKKSIDSLQKQIQQNKENVQKNALRFKEIKTKIEYDEAKKTEQMGVPSISSFRSNLQHALNDYELSNDTCSKVVDILLSLVVENHVFVFNDYMLAESIFYPYYETESSHTIAASPSWIDSSLCEKEFTDLLCVDSKYSVLIIRDADKGFIPGYLTPNLTSFISNNNSNLRKVVIVFESIADYKSMKDVLGVGLFFTPNLVKKIVDESQCAICESRNTSPLFPNELDRVVYSKTTKSLLDFFTKTNLKIDFPSNLGWLFEINFRNLKHHFEKQTARKLAYSLAIEPYMKNVYGSTKTMVLTQQVLDYLQ